VNCKVLIELVERVKECYDIALPTITLYLMEKCIGRVNVAKKLRVSERTARKTISRLIEKRILVKSYDTCIDPSIASSIGEISSIELSSNRFLTILYVEDDILELVDKYTVALRDYVLIMVKDPRALEIIGYYDGHVIVMPGVPSEYRSQYMKLLENISWRNKSVFIIWRKYRDYFSEASLLYGLYRVCLERIDRDK